MEDQRPVLIRWKKRTWKVVEIVDQWREQGRWWNREAEVEFYLVEISRGLILLGHRTDDRQWFVKSVR